ncbi:hypothetical protein Droror1_Dr00021754 [Drosera rotundifolia]
MQDMQTPLPPVIPSPASSPRAIRRRCFTPPPPHPSPAIVVVIATTSPPLHSHHPLPLLQPSLPRPSPINLPILSDNSLLLFRHTHRPPPYLRRHIHTPTPQWPPLLSLPLHPISISGRPLRTPFPPHCLLVLFALLCIAGFGV